MRLIDHMKLSRSQVRIALAPVVLIGVLGLVILVFRTHDFSLSEVKGDPRGLEFIWLQTMYDPILALPGSEPSAIARAVAALKAGEEGTRSAYTGTEYEHVTNLLHPYDFLGTLSGLESARRDFVEAPSYWRALRYHLALMGSLLRLEDYSRSLSDTIYDLDVGADLGVPGASTSRLHIARTLAKAYSDANLQQAEVFRRLRCLLPMLFADDCAIHYPHLEIEPDRGEVIDREEVFGYAEALRGYLFSSPPYRARAVASTASDDLPLVLVRTPACGTVGSHAYLFFWRDSRTSGITSLFTTPVDEIFFHKTADGNSLFEVALAEAGVAYAYQQMNPYLCFDYSLDAGTVRTAYAVYEALSSSPIGSSYPKEVRTDAVERLISNEQAVLADNKIIDTGAIDSLMSTLAMVLHPEAGDSGLAESDQVRLLNLLTMWRAKSAWLETEIATMEDMATTNLYVFRVMDIPLSALFVSRSYYSTLLLAGNETLYQQPLVFAEVRNNQLPKRSDLVSYQKELMNIIPLDKLADFMSSEGQKSSRVYTTE